MDSRVCRITSCEDDDDRLGCRNSWQCDITEKTTGLVRRRQFYAIKEHYIYIHSILEWFPAELCLFMLLPKTCRGKLIPHNQYG